MVVDIAATEQWAQLAKRADNVRATSLRELFVNEDGRIERLTFDVDTLHVDLSKNLMCLDGFVEPVELARVAGIEEARKKMFRGDKINTTENHSVLHIALCLPVEEGLTVGDQDVAAGVHEVLGRMHDLACNLRSGDWLGCTGHTIRTVIDIGIGDSDLGPAMVTKASRTYAIAGIDVRFVSNIDPSDLQAVLDEVDPESTLFIVTSETFTTQETLPNAHAARRRLIQQLSSEEAVVKHFVAVPMNVEKVAEFGIDTENMSGFWDWVGGRYSADSAIGLSIMVVIGPMDSMRFLQGFRVMDEHLLNASLEQNVPVLMGMLNVWYSSFLDAQPHAVLPYSEDLSRFPAYLQQLTTGSNGKSMRIDGKRVDYNTGEIFWGEPGTNGQHAFFQFPHQETRLAPADLIGFARPHQDLPTASGEDSMHDLLMSNFFVQTKVLAFGKTVEEIHAEGVAEELVEHKVMPGSRPTTTIMAEELTPDVVGVLTALHEHVTLVEGIVRDLNSLDQRGVELGKQQADDLLPAATDEVAPDSGDASTDALLTRYRDKHQCLLANRPR